MNLLLPRTETRYLDLFSGGLLSYTLRIKEKKAVILVDSSK
jgi:uncharacterized protein with von Willebrand factor type A (vWA) domain